MSRRGGGRGGGDGLPPLLQTALRRLQSDAINDADRSILSLKVLVKHVGTVQPYPARRQQVIQKTLKAMEIHRTNRTVAALAVEVLDKTLVEEQDEETELQLSKDMCACALIERIIEMKETFPGDQQLMRETMNLLGHTCSAMYEFEMRGYLLDKGVLPFVVDVLRAFLSDERICEMGMYIVHWFQCVPPDPGLEGTERRVSQSICGEALCIAIEGSINDFAIQSGHATMVRGNAEHLEEILGYPELVEAMAKDPVMGVVRKTYDTYKDSNQSIHKYGFELQGAVIQRQRKWAKDFRCTNCTQPLSKEERLVCSSCRAAIYCSKACQREHWKNGHKRECKS